MRTYNSDHGKTPGKRWEFNRIQGFVMFVTAGLFQAVLGVFIFSLAPGAGVFSILAGICEWVYAVMYYKK